MARYIDADKIHEFVDAKVAEGKDGWAKGVPYEWAYALTVIDMQPTADVVPKSEVERLEKENETLTINMNAFGLAAKRLAEEKSEVAREIFEEIQKSIVHNILHNESYSFEGVIDCITKDLDELKKKYI